MKFILTILCIIGAAFTAAVPRPQPLCSSNGISTAPEPVLNTLDVFNKTTDYDIMAQSAPTPTGYKRIMTSRNCALTSARYMRYSKVSSYDTQACAKLCDTHPGCDTFNIYVERYPSVLPGPECPNPPAIFNAICALYSEPITASACDNTGQFMGPQDANGNPFRTAIRASNAYLRLRVTEVVVTVTKTYNLFDHPEHFEASMHIASPKPKSSTATIATAEAKPTDLEDHERWDVWAHAASPKAKTSSSTTATADAKVTPVPMINTLVAPQMGYHGPAWVSFVSHSPSVVSSHPGVSFIWPTTTAKTVPSVAPEQFEHLTMETAETITYV